MKFGPNNGLQRTNESSPRPPSSFPPIPNLPPAALRWSAAASAAAAASYADRGASALAASSLLDELHWREGRLGEVQGAFFAGYALTQVLGGLLGGRADARRVSGDCSIAAEGGGTIDLGDDSVVEKTGGYRTVLPISLLFTGIITMLFPLAATVGGPGWASVDRFCLGLLEGLLLPAAMAGVSDTTSTTINKSTSMSNEVAGIKNTENESYSAEINVDNDASGSNSKATASSLVIAGCYLGSAFAYLSASFLFGEEFQLQVAAWGYKGSIWPWLFYANGILSIACLFFFREEFNLFESVRLESHRFPSAKGKNENGENGFTLARVKVAHEGLSALSTQNSLWRDTVSIAKATLTSKSGRAILAAQIGQGALLYTVASWGPLYLERATVMDVESSVQSDSTMSPSISSVAATASIAASSLILPQITQAFVGISIGANADALSSKIGTRTTRRVLQLISGVGPAAVLWYSFQEGVAGGEISATPDWRSPALLFGTAQTVSALSLGAVSVSHLDIATPSSAGAVYALGNVAAAASGSFMVSWFGRFLEKGVTGADTGTGGGGGGDVVFAVPFRVVAVLSAVGSLIYGCTVESKLEIGFNGTRATM